jgi:hypothetical protein
MVDCQSGAVNHLDRDDVVGFSVPFWDGDGGGHRQEDVAGEVDNGSLDFTPF